MADVSPYDDSFLRVQSWRDFREPEIESDVHVQ